MSKDITIGWNGSIKGIRQRTVPCLISTIIWYEHAKIHAESNFGFGGPKDPRFPQEYFFSETGLSKAFDEFTDKDEYCSYMKEVQSQHLGVPLIPSFQIFRKHL